MVQLVKQQMIDSSGKPRDGACLEIDAAWSAATRKPLEILPGSRIERVETDVLIVRGQSVVDTRRRAHRLHKEPMRY